MDDVAEQKNKFLLPMGPGREPRIFNSFADYVAEIREESRNWEWINSRNHVLGRMSARIYQLIVQPLYINALNGRSEGEISHPLSIQSNKYLPIYSFTPEGQYVLAAKSNHGEGVAALVLYYLSLLSYKGGEIDENSLDEVRTNPEVNQKAIELVLCFRLSATLQSEINTKCLDEAYQSFNRRAEAHLDEMEMLLAKAKNDLLRQDDEYQQQFSGQKARFKQLIGRYVSIANKTKDRLREKYEEAKADVAQAQQAYHEKIDLEYSVNYWKERRRSHAWDRFWWGIGVFASLMVTFLGMLAYYLYGGISGIVLRAGGRISQNSTLEGQITEAFVADIAGAALLLTLLAVLVRLALRQFNIFTQLHIEAAERVTMVKTYLALLNEGKLIADQDRRLALESLFRSSQLTPAADSGFNTPVDMMIKTLAERVGK